MRLRTLTRPLSLARGGRGRSGERDGRCGVCISDSRGSLAYALRISVAQARPNSSTPSAPRVLNKPKRKSVRTSGAHVCCSASGTRSPGRALSCPQFYPLLSLSASGCRSGCRSSCTGLQLYLPGGIVWGEALRCPHEKAKEVAMDIKPRSSPRSGQGLAPRGRRRRSPLNLHRRRWSPSSATTRRHLVCPRRPPSMLTSRTRRGRPAVEARTCVLRST